MYNGKITHFHPGSQKHNLQLSLKHTHKHTGFVQSNFFRIEQRSLLSNREENQGWQTTENKAYCVLSSCKVTKISIKCQIVICYKGAKPENAYFFPLAVSPPSFFPLSVPPPAWCAFPIVIRSFWINFSRLASLPGWQVLWLKRLLAGYKWDAQCVFWAKVRPVASRRKGFSPTRPRWQESRQQATSGMGAPELPHSTIKRTWSGRLLSRLG